MATPLFPIFQKRINDATEKLIKNQVTPWVFMTSGDPFKVKDFDGGEISYKGIKFKGSPRHVFWTRYIDPFVEALILEEIATAISKAKENQIDARLLLPEVQAFLVSSVHKIFDAMSDVDQRLLGHGFPDSIPRRSVDSEINRLSDFIGQHIKSELDMWKPKSRIEELYEKNKFLTWVVGTLIALGGLATKFFS
jgi:hypothetical protein